MRKEDEQRIFRAHALLELKGTPGWAILHAEIKERLQDSVEKLSHWMDTKPDLLTGKVAFRHAMRHKAYSELLEWIDEEIEAGEGLR